MSRNRVRTHTATAATAAALLAALAGCNSASEAAPPGVKTASPSASPSPTSSSSPVATAPATAEQQAAVLAQQTVHQYLLVTDQLGADPSGDPAVLKTVAVGSSLVEANNAVINSRAKARHQIGGTAVVSMTVDRVDLRLDAQRQPPVIPTVAVKICYDVSGLNVVDGTGKSVVTTERKDRALEVFGVANYNYPDPKGWRVAYTTVKGDPCADPL